MSMCQISVTFANYLPPRLSCACCPSSPFPPPCMHSEFCTCSMTSRGSRYEKDTFADKCTIQPKRRTEQCFQCCSFTDDLKSMTFASFSLESEAYYASMFKATQCDWSLLHTSLIHKRTGNWVHIWLALDWLSWTQGNRQILCFT